MRQFTDRLRQDAQDRELDAAERILPLRHRAQPHLRPPPQQLDVLAQGGHDIDDIVQDSVTFKTG